MNDPDRSSTILSREGHAFDHLTTIADTVARASTAAAAIDAVANGLSRSFQSRVHVFGHTPRGWVFIAQSGGRMHASLSDLDAALQSMPSAAVTSLDLRHAGETVWTSLSLEHSGMPVWVLIAGDWTANEAALTGWAFALSFALRCARERAERHTVERTLLHGYMMGRRLSRLGELEAVCERLVEQLGQAMHAERVALALYRPEEDRLAIVATSGYPAESVKDVRIEPGAWVVGHVYLSRRPVLVKDAGQIQRPTLEQRRYRTKSFVAVPMLAGGQTVGVLTATDKRDGSPFTEHDARAMRIFSVSAALAIQAARHSAEASRLAYAATIDALTGLFNRHYLDARLHQEIERARRSGTSLTLLLLDIDDFKTVNDTMGHQVGDSILNGVGNVLRSSVRVFDICARLGGDEFAIVLPGSDQARATASAERIRQRIAAQGSFSAVPQLTVSLGVAVFRNNDAAEDLIRRADRLLYLAKAQGKNRVCSGNESAKVERPFFRQSGGGPA